MPSDVVASLVTAGVDDDDDEVVEVVELLVVDDASNELEDENEELDELVKLEELNETLVELTELNDALDETLLKETLKNDDNETETDDDDDDDDEDDVSADFDEAIEVKDVAATLVLDKNDDIAELDDSDTTKELVPLLTPVNWPATPSIHARTTSNPTSLARRTITPIKSSQCQLTCLSAPTTALKQQILLIPVPLSIISQDL